MAVHMAKAKFLCGVMQVVSKALVRMKGKRCPPREMGAVLRTYGHRVTNPATPTRKLALVKVRFFS